MAGTIWWLVPSAFLVSMASISYSLYLGLSLNVGLIAAGLLSLAMVLLWPLPESSDPKINEARKRRKEHKDRPSLSKTHHALTPTPILEPRVEASHSRPPSIEAVRDEVSELGSDDTISPTETSPLESRKFSHKWVCDNTMA